MSPRLSAREHLERVREAVLGCLPAPEDEWPPDVRVIHDDIRSHLFDPGLRVKDILARCGLADHNAVSRFGFYLGQTPKQFIIEHRIKAVKQMLVHPEVRVAQAALAVGYESPSALTPQFKRRVGQLPSEYKDKYKEDL